MTSPTADCNGVPRAKSTNQHVGAFIASLGGFALGVSLGWNSNAGETLRNNLDATVTDIALIGGALNVGACIGVLLPSVILGHVSRVRTMVLAVPIYVVGWMLICLGDQTVSLLIAGRLICGICGGMSCLLTPIYVAEIADKKIRGRLLALFHLLINCGIMYAFLIAHALDKPEMMWRYSLVCAITCLAALSSYLLPESPLYYLRKNDVVRAGEAFKWYHGENCNIEDEPELKRLALTSRSRKITMKALMNRRVLRSLLMCFGVMLIQQLCGINTMISYALTLFNIGGSGELTGSEQTLVVGAVQILSCLLAAVLIDTLGRRILLTVSSMFMGLFLILLGWFFNLRESDPEYDDIYSWMPPTWCALYFAAFNVGLGPISWSLLGDVLPFEIRVTAAAIAASLGWLASLLAAFTIAETVLVLGVTKLLWLFAGFCWLAAVFFVVVVRDTSGESLGEIQGDFRIDNRRPNGSTSEES